MSRKSSQTERFKIGGESRDNGFELFLTRIVQLFDAVHELFEALSSRHGYSRTSVSPNHFFEPMRWHLDTSPTTTTLMMTVLDRDLPTDAIENTIISLTFPFVSPVSIIPTEQNKLKI